LELTEATHHFQVLRQMVEVMVHLPAQVLATDLLAMEVMEAQAVALVWGLEFQIAVAQELLIKVLLVEPIMVLQILQQAAAEALAVLDSQVHQLVQVELV
jgi:hypothetical protein